MTTASACSAVKLACQQVMAKLSLLAGPTAAQRTAAFEKLKLGAVEETGNFVSASSR